MSHGAKKHHGEYARTGKERPETNLVVLPIDNVQDAHRVFGVKTDAGNTPIILKPSKRSGLRMVIPHGFDSIVTENGKVLGVFKPGLYYRSSFFQIANVVKTQHIPYHFAIKSCPTRDNIHINVEVDFLLHVTNSVRFVYQIGPENMENLLRATQAEVVRSLVRSVSSSEAYDLRGTDSGDMLVALNEKMTGYGIYVDQVSIANVTLPSDVAFSLQATTTYDAKQNEANKKQEYQMKVMDDAQYLKRVEQNRKNEFDHAKEKAHKSHQNIEHDIGELKAKLQKELAAIDARLNDQSAQIKAECEREVSQMQQERDKLVTEILGNAKVQVQKRRADGERYVARVRAETMLKVAENAAKILDVQSQAERVASAHMAPRRDFELEQRRLGVLRALAQNPATVIAGEMEESPISQLYVATKSAELMGIKHSAAAAAKK
eukprot:TRINITY_DN728_c0_g1_i3.p1 TRINITY_DN728_c0_g1~~TRINITY_DN728_c0_g1_i3.p1  ORF type:complete len:434 (+),score=92.55 TRINITY_DN728_c0_g1_i3:65-1366(+)